VGKVKSILYHGSARSFIDPKTTTETQLTQSARAGREESGRAEERAPGHVAHQNKNKLQLMLIGVGALSLLGAPILSLAELNSW